MLCSIKQALECFPGLFYFLRSIHNLARDGSQFIVATHSPILLACPNADIYVLSPDGRLSLTSYRDTEPYCLTKMFLDDPERLLHYLLD